MPTPRAGRVVTGAADAWGLFCSRAVCRPPAPELPRASRTPSLSCWTPMPLAQAQSCLPPPNVPASFTTRRTAGDSGSGQPPGCSALTRRCPHTWWTSGSSSAGRASPVRASACSGPRCVPSVASRSCWVFVCLLSWAAGLCVAGAPLLQATCGDPVGDRGPALEEFLPSALLLWGHHLGCVA